MSEPRAWAIVISGDNATAIVVAQVILEARVCKHQVVELHRDLAKDDQQLLDLVGYLRRVYGAPEAPR